MEQPTGCPEAGRTTPSTSWLISLNCNLGASCLQTIAVRLRLTAVREISECCDWQHGKLSQPVAMNTSDMCLCNSSYIMVLQKLLLFVEEFLYLMSYISKRFWLDSKYKYVNIHFCVCRQQQICHFGCFITVLSPFYYKKNCL